EFPGVLGAVVPLVRAGVAVVLELVADLDPGFAAVVGALHDLAEPAAGLRGIETVGIGRRALDVVHLPSGEVGTGDVPLLPLLVRGHDERALARPGENPYSAHTVFLPPFPAMTAAERGVRAGSDEIGSRQARRLVAAGGGAKVGPIVLPPSMC